MPAITKKAVGSTSIREPELFPAMRFSNNVVNDAYCGVAHVTADTVQGGIYFNTLYNVLNSDLYPVAFPPAVEP
jgi:hypothetical protein